MEKLLAAVGLALVLMFSVPLLGCFFGGMSGWVAGLIFLKTKSSAS